MRASKVLAAAGIAGATVIATMLAAGPASASTDNAQLMDGYTVACNTPGDTANFSYSPGTSSTTVYYNNHCLHAVNVTIAFIDETGVGGTYSKCLVTEAGSKGSQKYAYLPGYKPHFSRGC